jgi:DNA (cytosine-5)-methyltransferase 1
MAVVDNHFGYTNLGDMTKITENDLEKRGPVDILVGGTPCQSFSVAGLRRGLDDPRGNLALRFLQLAGAIRPRWVLWENVHGVLSSDNGWAFAAIIGALVECGYGFAYRILDAQYFGVPQRRRRVFVVGYLGDWRRAAAVLFERESLSGHSPPSRETREEVTGTISARTQAGGGFGTDFDIDGGCVSMSLNGHGGIGRIDAESKTFVTAPLTQSPYADNKSWESLLVAHALRGEGFDASEDGTGRGTPLIPVAYRTSGNCGVMKQGNRTAALSCNTDQTQQIINGHFGVRRLTPRECERLQGFPDDYTLVEFRGKPAKDGPRYKALGNSMAVPVMRWIGERINQVENITQEQ